MSMKGKEKYYVKQRVKENGEWLLKDVAIDIYEVRNENGDSVGFILDTIFKNYAELTAKLREHVTVDTTWKTKTNELLTKIIEGLNEGE